MGECYQKKKKVGTGTGSQEDDRSEVYAQK
jgi:hypothetical protein